MESTEKIILSPTGKEVKINMLLTTRTLMKFEEFNRKNDEDKNESKLSLEMIKCQTSLKTDDEILDLDAETFEEISELVVGTIKNYAEKKNKKLDDLKTSGTETVDEKLI